MVKVASTRIKGVIRVEQGISVLYGVDKAVMALLLSQSGQGVVATSRPHAVTSFQLGNKGPWDFWVWDVPWP